MSNKDAENNEFSNNQTNVPVKKIETPKKEEFVKLIGSDLILFIFAVVLVGLIGFFLYNSQEKQKDEILKHSVKNHGIILEEQDSDIKTAFKLKVIKSLNHLDYSGKANLSSSSRKNASFLISTLLVLIGSIIILKTSQNSSVNNDSKKSKTNLISNLPGMVMVVMGSLVIISTILGSNIIDYEDEKINIEPLIRMNAEAKKYEEKVKKENNAETNKDEEKVKKENNSKTN